VQTQGAGTRDLLPLTDGHTKVSYYGTTFARVCTQPGNQADPTDKTHTAFNTAGANVIVAVTTLASILRILFLMNSLVTGYDHRGQERRLGDADVNQSRSQFWTSPSRQGQPVAASRSWTSRRLAVLDGPPIGGLLW